MVKTIFTLSFCLLAATISLSCGDSEEEIELTDEEKALAEIIEGDWVVYGTNDNAPEVADSVYFWTFEVTGRNFEMGRTCSGNFHTKGRIEGSNIYFEGESEALNIIDGKLIIHEKQEGEKVGRTFHAQPVTKLKCETNSEGYSLVSKQQPIFRYMAELDPSKQIKKTLGASSIVKAQSEDGTIADHLTAAYMGEQLPVGDENPGSQKPGTTPAVTSSKDPTGKLTITCTETEMTASQMLNAFRILDETGDYIYPGAIIQGGPYMKYDELKALTSNPDKKVRVRAPMDITISGPTLKSGVSNKITVQDPSKQANVMNAISQILGSENVIKGSLDYDEKFTFVSDEQQAKFALNVGGGAEGVNLSADFKASFSQNYNHFLYIYSRIFYTVSVPNFGDPTNAFADPNAIDPPNSITKEYEIGSGNPPIYLKSVQYGKQLFFEVTSEYSDVHVEAAIKASAADAPISGSSSLSASDVLEKTTIHIRARGGSDNFVDVGVLSGKGIDVYNQLSAQLNSFKSEQFTSSTPATPVGYTLNYLISDNVAKMLFTADYNEKTCTSSEDPVYSDFTYSILGYSNKGIAGLDDYMEVWIGKNIIKKYNSPGGDKQFPNQTNLISYLKDGNTHRAKFLLYNKGGWATGGTLKLYKDGNNIYSININGGTGAWTGKVFQVEFDLNLNGKCVQKYIYEPGKATAWNNIQYTQDKKYTYCTSVDEDSSDAGEDDGYVLE